MVTYRVGRPQHFRVQFFTLPQQLMSSTHRELEGVELMLKGNLVSDGGNVVYITDNSGSFESFQFYNNFMLDNFSPLSLVQIWVSEVVSS